MAKSLDSGADGPLLTATEANARGIPDGYRWDPDYIAPIGADGQRPGRVIYRDDEHIAALRRQEERRRLLAAAPPAPRLVPAQRAVKAVRRVVNGPSGRPKASSARSSARSGDSPDDDSEPEPPGQPAGHLAADLLAVVRDVGADVASARAFMRADSRAAPRLDAALLELARLAADLQELVDRALTEAGR